MWKLMPILTDKVSIKPPPCYLQQDLYLKSNISKKTVWLVHILAKTHKVAQIKYNHSWNQFAQRSYKVNWGEMQAGKTEKGIEAESPADFPSKCHTLSNGAGEHWTSPFIICLHLLHAFSHHKKSKGRKKSLVAVSHFLLLGNCKQLLPFHQSCFPPTGKFNSLCKMRAEVMVSALSCI